MKQIKIGKYSFTETDVEIIGSYMNECVSAVNEKFKGNTKVLKLDFMIALKQIEEEIINKFSTEEQIRIESYKTMLGTKHPIPFACTLASLLATAVVLLECTGAAFSVMLFSNAILAGIYMFTALEIRDYINLHRIIKMVGNNAISKED